MAAAGHATSGLDNTMSRGAKLTFVEFLKTYPCLDEHPFIGYFTVIDIVTMRLLCKDTAYVFGDEIL